MMKKFSSILCVLFFSLQANADLTNLASWIFDSSGNSLNSTSNALNSFITNSTLAVTQSGAWTTGRTWSLSSGSDSVSSVQSGTWNVGLNAGSNIIGKVAIDQTTPGTTNGVQVNAALPAGTNSIGQVTANAGTNLNTSALNLETTQSTFKSANHTDLTLIDTDLLSFKTANHTDIIGTQPRNITQFGGSNVVTGTGVSGSGIPRVTVSNDSKVQPWDGTNTITVKASSVSPASTDTSQVVGLSPIGNQVQGTVASGSTDSTNPVKIGGIYRAATQTFSDGQRADLQMNLHGLPLVDATTTDVSGTFTTSGNTAAIDASGFASIAFTATVTASSGTTPTLDLLLQESDDGVNDWNEEYGADRFTGTGSYKSTRQSLHARYYRFRYVITGTTPSFTFTVKTTLKVENAPTIHTYNRFNDLVMTTANNFSSTADLEGCSFWTATITRGAGGAGVTIVNQVSNDAVNWVNSTSTNSSASTSYLISNTAGSATKYARFTNTNNQAAATTLDIKWYCKE